MARAHPAAERIGRFSSWSFQQRLRSRKFGAVPRPNSRRENTHRYTYASFFGVVLQLAVKLTPAWELPRRPRPCNAVPARPPRDSWFDSFRPKQRSINLSTNLNETLLVAWMKSRRFA